MLLQFCSMGIPGLGYCLPYLAPATAAGTGPLRARTPAGGGSPKSASVPRSPPGCLGQTCQDNNKIMRSTVSPISHFCKNYHHSLTSIILYLLSNLQRASILATQVITNYCTLPFRHSTFFFSQLLYGNSWWFYLQILFYK